MLTRCTWWGTNRQTDLSKCDWHHWLQAQCGRNMNYLFGRKMLILILIEFQSIPGKIACAWLAHLKSISITYYYFSMSNSNPFYPELQQEFFLDSCPRSSLWAQQNSQDLKLPTTKLLTLTHHNVSSRLCVPGHLIGPVLCHSFCNYMGFPAISTALEHPQRLTVLSSYLLGVILFLFLLLPFTNPYFYGFPTPVCTLISSLSSLCLSWSLARTVTSCEPIPLGVLQLWKYSEVAKTSINHMIWRAVTRPLVGCLLKSSTLLHRR